MYALEGYEWRVRRLSPIKFLQNEHRFARGNKY